MIRVNISRLQIVWYNSWQWGRAWVGLGTWSFDLGWLRISWDHKPGA